MTRKGDWRRAESRLAALRAAGWAIPASDTLVDWLAARIVYPGHALKGHEPDPQLEAAESGGFAHLYLTQRRLMFEHPRVQRLYRTTAAEAYFQRRSDFQLYGYFKGDMVIITGARPTDGFLANADLMITWAQKVRRAYEAEGRPVPDDFW